MILSVAAPLGAVSAAAASNDDLDELNVSVDDTVVMVTSIESAVENATVNVSTVDENATYNGTGEYETDASGTVDLPEPNETVTVMVGASYENASGVELTDNETADLEPATDDAPSLDVTQDGNDVLVSLTAGDEGVSNTSVTASTVDENASYTDTGTHTTDENGTVTLTAPLENESVEVEFEATVDNETVTETATLEPAEYDNFGSLVSTFVEEEKENESDTPLGLRVAGFVVEHNPGNAPDHAGPPSHAGPPGDDEKDDQGPPGDDKKDDQGPPGDDKKDDQGPPAHAGGPPEDTTDGGADDTDGEDSDDDTKKGNGGGPPANAGPSK